MRARLPASTFALAVKEELCALPISGGAGRAELHGLIRAAGSLLLRPGGGEARGAGPAEGRGPSARAGGPLTSAEVRCVRAVVARRVYRLFRDVAGARPVLLVRRSAGAADGRFVCRVGDAAAVLESVGVLDRFGRPRPRIPAALRSARLAPALLRGFFLGAGSVDDPVRDHHMELDVDGGAPDVAADLMEALAACGVRGRSTPRRGRIVVYLKDGGAIAALIAAMGAGTALMAYEEQRIRRQVRSDVNRLVNAETANLSKSAATGVEQARAVAALQAAGRLDSLPDGLRALALARLHHPEVSLRELGQLLHPPLSKSGVQHRLRTLAGLLRRALAERGPRAGGSQ